jgi:hypothetical protein
MASAERPSGASAFFARSEVCDTIFFCDSRAAWAAQTDARLENARENAQAELDSRNKGSGLKLQRAESRATREDSTGRG